MDKAASPNAHRGRAEGATAAGLCATIGAGIESNGANDAESSLLRTYYAGSACGPFFDLAGHRGNMRHQCERMGAGSTRAEHRFTLFRRSYPCKICETG